MNGKNGRIKMKKAIWISISVILLSATWTTAETPESKPNPKTPASKTTKKISPRTNNRTPSRNSNEASEEYTDYADKGGNFTDL